MSNLCERAVRAHQPGGPRLAVMAAFYEQAIRLRSCAAGADYWGPDLEAGTGVPGAALQGVHLRLPGHGPTGPTLGDLPVPA